MTEESIKSDDTLCYLWNDVVGAACRRVIVDLKTIIDQLTRYINTAGAVERYCWDEKEALIEDIELRDHQELIFKVRTLRQACNEELGWVRVLDNVLEQLLRD